MTTSVPASSKPQRYAKDPRGLTRFLITMLWLSVAVEVVVLLSDYAQLALLRGQFTHQQALANDQRQQMTGILGLVVFLVTGICYLMWIYRANLNCRGFGTQGMRFTPGWAVGWQFVPFMNLVRPYQVMKEIWLSAHHPGNPRWMLEPSSALIGWWWAAWLIGASLSQGSARMLLRAETVEQLQTATVISIVASVVAIPACLLLMELIKSINAQHESLTNP